MTCEFGYFEKTRPVETTLGKPCRNDDKRIFREDINMKIQDEFALGAIHRVMM